MGSDEAGALAGLIPVQRLADESGEEGAADTQQRVFTLYSAGYDIATEYAYQYHGPRAQVGHLLLEARVAARILGAAGGELDEGAAIGR